MTKKELLNRIERLEERVENLEEKQNREMDNTERFLSSLLDYLGLDLKREKKVEWNWGTGDKIVPSYTISKKKSNKSKK